MNGLRFLLTCLPNMARAAVLPRYMARPQCPMVTRSSENPCNGKAATSPAAHTPGKEVAMEESTGMKPLASTSRPATLLAMPEAGVTPTPTTARSAVRSLSLLEFEGVFTSLGCHQNPRIRVTMSTRLEMSLFIPEADPSEPTLRPNELGHLSCKYKLSKSSRHWP